MHPREKNFETTAVKEKCTSYMKKKKKNVSFSYITGKKKEN